MATARKAPAKRAATQPPIAAKRAGARAPAVHKAGAKRAAPNGAANGAAHKPSLRTAAAKSARAKVDGERVADALPREAAVTAAEPAARKARVSEAAVPVQLSDAETVARPPYWDKACADLVKRDRILKKLIPKFGPAHLVKRGDSFVTLARSVVGQQISVAAAQSVWVKIETACPKLAPPQIIKLGQEKLIACGLSKRKSEYILDLARHFVSGALHVDKWATMDDEGVIAELTQIRGIGRWTAEMFLIFNLSRPDVLPLDDLGLIRAISVNYFSGEPVTRSEAREVAANWEPWRTVATWYMWRSLDPLTAVN
ncbi:MULTISPECIES: DNA-3-methyladenine glycosylase [Burkholderia]|uniref:DNA-3-methyladenine glycosylase II n=2 Tax=Burkholderia humptydooensis TaxID=430531 RepID=A0A7U4SS24_9BURK|nr:MULTISPECIES: DNA-3-methyladenine glycosylase [Burkholderia]AGK46106.1 hhH-GPD superbase excision DNA repair family protein [Burkholderia thailandensis MSMB121]ATF36506.1 DNA-3-methyladenine glycosylase 2 family protein [Burkholderia thailandensis]AJY40745.1 hhH-GPD superbase excision DNA repair family protein [Burkholderia sp. 2002721687]ALX42212.1 DNA-3-methyladenine glycosylase [Burkholderia humptydooensis]KST73895.1 DNA-3-methyladenine glycosylase [Burkholderia humptydooensis]